MTGSGVRRLPGWAPILPAALFMLLFYVVPLLRFVAISVTEPHAGLGNYINLVQPIYLRAFLATFEISAIVAFFCLIFGYPAALVLARIEGVKLACATACVVVPLFTSDLVRNYAWIFLLGRRGVINSLLVGAGITDQPIPMVFDRFAVLLAQTHLLLPYSVLLLAGMLRSLDRRLPIAASSLGAGAFGTFRRVILPLSLRGALGGMVLVFVIALASYVTPAMLGGRTDIMTANLIGSDMNALNWGMAATLGTVMLVLTLLSLVVMNRVGGGFGQVAPGMGQEATRRRPMRVGRMWRLGLAVDRVLDPVWPALTSMLGWGVILFLALPLLVILPLSTTPLSYFTFPPPGVSLRWYAAVIADPEWGAATINSLILAVSVAIGCLLLGVPAAHAIVRARGRLLMPTYLMLLSPLVVPSVVIAVSVFFLLSAVGLLHTLLGVGLGQAVTALPPALVVLVVALQGFDWRLARASQSLGASPLRTMLRVTLPVIRGELAVAAFLGFLHSFNDLLVALFASGLRTETLPKRMWESLQEIDPTIAAVATIIMVFTLVLLMFAYLPGQLRARRLARAVRA